ncbi:MAG: ABC transporter substrate-binding protein [Chloroflexota bacterium]
MKFARLLMLILCILVLTVPSFAQDEEANDDIPVVAILKFGDLINFNLSEQGSLDMFEAYGYVDGENIEFIFGEAQFDRSTASELATFALEREPDVIITLSTPVAISVADLTRNMENPPALVFNIVADVIGAGLVESSCIKADHMTGSQVLLPFNALFTMIGEFEPDIDTIGIMYNDEEANSVLSVAIIRELADAHGINLLEQTISNANVAQAAAEAMLMSGVDAFLIPPDSVATSATSVISEAATLAGIPVFSLNPTQLSEGSTVAFGPDYYQEGVDAARIAIHHLLGNIDVANIALNNQTSFTTGVNLDSAMAQNVEIPMEIVTSANLVIENGESTATTPALPEMTLEDRMEADMAFLDELYCSDERIAEEQATLDTQSE